MTAAIIVSILRTAAGEPPLGHGARSFRDDQGEIIRHDNERYASVARIGVLELDTGEWLIWKPGGFPVDALRYDSRAEAIEVACTSLMALARLYMAAKPGEGTQWSEELGNAVIKWASKIQDDLQRTTQQDAASVGQASVESASKEINPDINPVNVLGAKTGAEEITLQAKPNPYLIEGPALISFSGGRTSAYMLYQIVQAYRGKLPDNIHVLFANTGKEREETLRFVRECAECWAVNVRWVEWIPEKPGYREVSYETASRFGQPFDALLAKKKMPPNWRARFCTEHLKVRAMTAFATELLGWVPGHYKEVVGLRDDEGHRIFKMLERNEKDGRQCIAPLAKAKVTKPIVLDFFKAQPFDLDLKDGDGNCDMCFMKGQAVRVRIEQERPGTADWWAKKEAETGGFFDRRVRYSEIIARSRSGQVGEAQPIEDDAECDLTCGLDGLDEEAQSQWSGPDYDNPNVWKYGDDDAKQLMRDPIVRQLVEDHRNRVVFPAKHTFSMTNPIENGTILILATCKCGHAIKFGAGDQMRVDAAIEAHWRRFSHEPTVDGRGQPIVPGQFRGHLAEKKSRKKKNIADGVPSAPRSEPAPVPGNAPHGESAGSPLSPEAGGTTAPQGPAPGANGPPGAGEIEAAPIGATSENVITSPDDVDDLDLAWPSYDQFLEDKIVVAPMKGIEVARDALHPYLKPHCKDLTVWALRLGCAAIFASFGLHKTAMQLEWCRQLVKHTGQPSLCVLPLGVRHGFIKEALSLGMDVRFIRTTEELDDLYCEGVRHFLTNYESVRDGKLDPNQFGAVSLDEASVLRSYGSKTFQEFLPLFDKVAFKLVATATPSPNRYKELIHYAGFLGVMDTGLALTRWFQRNSEKAGDLTLYPHKEDEFWMWVHSWAAFLQKPSELGYSDDGYELPPLQITWHEVPADHSKAEPERDGQGVMFRDVAVSLKDAAAARRDSLPARIAKMSEIIEQDPSSTFLIWHDLEAEREAIEQALPEVVTITGSMDIDAREERLHDFEEGRIKYFGTKPVLSGSGSNFQYHCHKAIYVCMPGYGYKFNDYLQSLFRLQRFGQTHPVEVHIIYSEDERAGKAVLEEKGARDAEMRQRMSEIIKRHGLNTLPLRDALLRSLGVKRVEIAGENFRAINNDAVKECVTWPEASVDLMVTSIPFSNHYEYSASYRDFGHTDDNAHFWSQMDFLTCELLRMLKPGRLACIHVKDRVLFGAVTGQGVPTISPFHAEAIMHYRAHGFQYMGMITVVTDVVRENNQTYRLGWSENAKDSTKMGVGSPEYVLLLRKPQSNRTKSYADEPVTKVKPDLFAGEGEGYSRARWQIDAHAFWRSSGNRLLSTAEFAEFESADMARVFAKLSADRIYDFEAHVAIGEGLERKGTLPATFMSIAPGSHHGDVWHDVNRMRTLNMLQQRKGAEMHLCPLQFDIVDRLIERYSNEGELVFDPFGGLMTVPYRAILKGRKGAATELSATYFMDGVHYLRAAEEKMAMPALFDLKAFDEVNAELPPPATTA